MNKILFITAFPPNKFTAGQNYTRQLLNDLVRENEVDLIYWKYPNHELDVSSKVNVLVSYNIEKANKGFKAFYFPLFSKRYNKKIQYYINSISNNYDLIYFDFSQVFLYSLNIKHPLKIGMAHDVIAQKYNRHKFFRYLMPWIKVTERKCLEELDYIFTFSKKDSDFILKKYEISSLNVPFYLEAGILNLDFNKIEIGNYFVMYGAWNRDENQESIKWLLDNISNFNEYKIKIIGGGMPDALINKIMEIPTIKYIGFVDNPYPIIASSCGLIAPLFHGAGVKVKAIESLALGTPVLGTNVTFEGIDNLPFKYNCMALRNINCGQLSNILEIFQNITIQDKITLRNLFLKNYCSSKFVDQLNIIKK